MLIKRKLYPLLKKHLSSKRITLIIGPRQASKTTPKPIAIKVKYSQLKKEEITRSLKSFIKKYQPEKAFIFNLSLEKKINFKNTKIYFLPYYSKFSFAIES